MNFTIKPVRRIPDVIYSYYNQLVFPGRAHLRILCILNPSSAHEQSETGLLWVLLPFWSEMLLPSEMMTEP